MPTASVDAYKSKTPWKKFQSIVGISSENPQGDVNDDGKVNGTDIQTVINLIVAEEYNESADVNGDGKVNGTDIQAIINIIVNEE